MATKNRAFWTIHINGEELKYWVTNGGDVLQWNTKSKAWREVDKVERRRFLWGMETMLNAVKTQYGQKRSGILGN